MPGTFDEPEPFEPDYPVRGPEPLNPVDVSSRVQELKRRDQMKEIESLQSELKMVSGLKDTDPQRYQTILLETILTEIRTLKERIG